MSWCLPLPQEIQKLIRNKVEELYIRDKHNSGWIKINQFINSSELYDFSLHMSEHIFHFDLEFECVMRIPKLEAID